MAGGLLTRGGRESIGDGQDGPPRVTARNIESGQHKCPILYIAKCGGSLLGPIRHGSWLTTEN